MMAHLTSTNPALDAAIRATKPGMAYWATTSEAPHATCGGCIHHGAAPSRHKKGAPYGAACALFRKFSGHNGKLVPSTTPACKYYETK